MVKELGWKQIVPLILVGFVAGLHWITFYGSIKLANASIALIALATTSFFAAILEPLIFKSPFRWLDLILGIVIIPAMGLIVYSVQESMILGIWVGLASALLAALFAILSKRYMNEISAVRVSFLEIFGAFILLSIILPFTNECTVEALTPTKQDWMYLIFLALICTSFAQYLAIRALKYISAFNFTLTVNLEPVYGIILAILLLKENKELNTQFYIGVVIIVITVFSYPYLKKRFD